MSSFDNKYNIDDCAWIDNIIQEHKKSKILNNKLLKYYRVTRIIFAKKYNNVK